MAEDRQCGLFGGNCEILFFILVFLCLFYCGSGYGFGGFGGCGCGYKE